MPDELKRIDPWAIPELFKKHGFMPASEHFYLNNRGTHCGCVNTILVVEAKGVEVAVEAAKKADGTSDSPNLAILSGLNPNYAIGLARGWDDMARFHGDEATPEEVAGHEDGSAAWDACIAAMTVYDGNLDIISGNEGDDEDA
jgi:hypothetical protein